MYDVSLREGSRGGNDPQLLIEDEGRGAGAKGESLETGEDPGGCPMIFGPPTDFVFTKMMPLPRFADLVGLNRRPWLRIYDEQEEKERLEAAKAARNTKLTAAQIQASNREWPYSLNHYLKQHDKQGVLDIPRFQKYPMDPNEQFYCYADFYPP